MAKMWFVEDTLDGPLIECGYCRKEMVLLTEFTNPFNIRQVYCEGCEEPLYYPEGASW